MGQLKNQKQERFCRYYVSEVNGTLFNGYGSAVKAGYSEKTAASQASRLLTKVNIKARIEELKQTAIDKLEINQLYALTKLKKIVDDDIRNYLSYKPIEVEYTDFETGDTDVRYDIDVKIKNSNDVDTWNISEITVGKDGQFKFKTHCKDKALYKMMEYLGMTTPEDAKDGVSLEEQLKHIKTLSDFINNPQPNRSLGDE